MKSLVASVAEAHAALAAAGAAFAADLPNYTNLRPSLRVAEVLKHAGPGRGAP